MSPTSLPELRPKVIGFLLLDNFTLISLASAIEPLRMANQLSGRDLYRWVTISKDGKPTHASDGICIPADSSIQDAPRVDSIIVCGGIDIQHSVTREHVQWLQQLAQKQKGLGAICTGTWALAKAGVLDGCECSVHWECLTAMRELFPRVKVSTRLFTFDQNRFTSSGGTSPLDMMLQMINREHGRELAVGISEMFIYERIRNEQDHQRVPLKHTLGTQQPKLQKVAELMEANVEEPITLDELAVYADVSRRQLERLFQKYLNCSPSRYYLNLRLMRARQLLKQTSMSIIEIASVCGFVSTPHFSKCYREYFNIPPRDERQEHYPGPTMPTRLESADVHAGMNVALLSLSKAKSEATFASVRLSS